MSNALDLRNALELAVYNIGLSYPIKWPNGAFSTPNNAPYVRYTPLYSTPTEYSLSQTDIVDGIVQLDVYIPVGAATGDAQAYEIAGEIQQGLPINGTKVFSGNVGVTFKKISATGRGESDGWYKVMVEAAFQSFIDRRL